MVKALSVAAVAAGLALTAAGCAAVPTSGAVQQIGAGQAAGSQEQDYSQPIPVPPGENWTAQQIVSGFLAASASFADNHAVARKYLDASAQKNWKPSWAVTVVGDVKSFPVVTPPRNVGLGSSSQSTSVGVSGLQVATLTDNGESLPISQTPRASFTFSLIRSDDQWRIDRLNNWKQLLLTQADFQRVYQPRDLYFLGPKGHTLVPDPVFVPQQDTNTQLATGLVNALLQDPKGWLNGAVGTGFPRNTIQLGQVRINGPNATVDLGGAAARAGRSQQEQMAAQLAWTLASGPTPVQSVELEINGRPLQLFGSPIQLAQTYQGWLPNQSAGSSLYFVGKNGAVSALSGAGQPGPGGASRSAPVPGAAGSVGVPALSSIAVSPDGRSIAGIAAGGTSIYIGGLGRNGTLRPWPTPSRSRCTSLSWDAQGDLWIVAGDSVWMLPPGQSHAAQASLPGGTISSFQVAPDGVRAVMISGGQVQVVAITHTGQSPSLGPAVTIGAGIADPQAVSWYDADDVIVLGPGPSGSQLEEVPLNGGNPTQIAAEDDIVSMTATSPGGSSPDVAIGLADGEIMVSANGGAFQDTHFDGQAPAYPG